MPAPSRRPRLPTPSLLRLLGVLAAHGALGAGACFIVWSEAAAPPPQAPALITLRLGSRAKLADQAAAAAPVPQEFEIPPVAAIPLPPESTAPAPPAPAPAPTAAPAAERSKVVAVEPASKARPPRSRARATGSRDGGGESRTATGVARGETAPVLIRSSVPDYPLAARTANAEGSALVRVTVDAQGRVTAARVSHSAGHSALDATALEAVRGWRFRPATHDGRPVAAQTLVRVRFSLR